MKRIFTIVCVLMSIALASCTYDDTPLWNKVNNHESRIAALEELCRETNTNLEALRTLVQAVQNADYITSVTPIKEGGDVVGYTITFAKSEPITIYNGTDGKDGQDGQDGQKGEQGEPSVIVPEIGIKKDVDGIYYWTIDGEWLTDNNGNKIPAVAEKGDAGADGEDGKDGTNGKDGKDGITPQLKIDGDYWFVSYDEGKTWIQLGRATSGNGGSGADSIFSKVDVGTDSVTFTMLDGTSFTIKFYAKPEIAFEGIVEGMVYYEEQEFEISYTVMGGDDETLVESFASGPYWSAMAIAESATTGKIKIEAGEGDGKVVVIVTTGMGSVTMKSILFEAGKVVGIDNLYRVDNQAGTLNIEFQTNFDLDDCEVAIDCDWLTIADTRAEMHDESLTFNYTANPYNSERWTYVDIYTKDGGWIEGFNVVQDAAVGPVLPEDIYPESTSFAHSLLFVMHTGMNEPYSPTMIDNLFALEEQYPEYNNNYNIVTCHAGTFAGGDPANSPAANVVNKFYSPDGYPKLDVNFYTTKVVNASESGFINQMMGVFDNYLDKDGADAGISIATEADSDVVYVSTAVKAAVEQEYKVTAWLLESGIYGNQAGATQDYHKIYNHALRNIADPYDESNIQGESIGVLEAGATAIMGFELGVSSSKWSVDNMEVLVIVSALNDDNKWEVVNTKVCPINSSVDFYSSNSEDDGNGDDEDDSFNDDYTLELSVELNGNVEETYTADVSVLPSTQDMHYIVMVASQEYLNELGPTDKDLYNDDYAYFEFLAGFYDMSTVEVMLEYALIGNGTKSFEFSDPGEYVAYAYYFDSETGKRLSHIFYHHFYIDEWAVLGEGIFYEDFISWVYGATAGNYANVTIEESLTRPGYYRMLNPFSQENIATFLGSTPSDLIWPEEDVYVEINATDPNAVVIPFQPAGFTIEEFGEVWIGYVSDRYGSLNKGNITFPAKTIGLLSEDGSGYYANVNGLFKVVLPGYVDKTERLATPTLYTEEISDSSFKVMWDAIDGAAYYLVDDGVNEHVVYDTYFTLSGLASGTYTVRVKAVADDSSPYLDSEYASITHMLGVLTPEECDWAEWAVSLPTDEYADDGYFPFTHIFLYLKGTGIVEIKTGVFEAKNYANAPAIDLIGMCNPLYEEHIDGANSDNGLTLVYQAEAETTYRAISAITNVEGKTVIFDELITTAEAQPHPAMEAFVGTWTVSTAKTMIIDETIRVEDTSMSKTVTITPALEVNYQAVYITGLSTNVDYPALGWVSYENDVATLYINNQEIFDIVNDNYIGWGAFCEVQLDGSDIFYSRVYGSYPAFTVKNGVGTGFVGELSGGGTCKVMSVDLLAYDENYNAIGYFTGVDSDPENIVLLADTQTWTRISTNTTAARKTYNKRQNNYKITPMNNMHSLVIK